MKDKIPSHVQMAPVQSSQIKEIGHDAQAGHLYVRFHAKNGPGSVYRYADVPVDKHQALLGIDAETGQPINGHSIGKHFGANFKSNQAHPWTKLNLDE